MAGTLNAGSVIYEVDMDTSRLLAARREVDATLNGLSGNMGRLEASVNRTERSVSSINNTLSGLSSVAKSVIAALSVQQVAAWGNEWVTVNNKLVNAVRGSEQLADVTQRVFDLAQDSRGALGDTATLYGRLERATRSAGTSTKDLATLTETINKGLVVSGATAEEASSVMVQLSQALASGVLRGEEFNAISENGSRLAVALADSLGVTVGELRNMAGQGKLTTDVVVNGLLKQADPIAKEFANTAMTMGQALTVATNNIVKFVGESSTVSSGINAFNDTVITLSNNLDVIGTAVAGLAMVFGGRFAGALAAATSSQAANLKTTIQGVAATRTRAKEEAAAASVTARKATADKGAALSALNVAKAEYEVAKGSAAEATALANVTRLRGAYIESAAAAAVANNALAASEKNVAATGLTMANALKAVRLAIAPLGGVVGIVSMLAAGWYLYAQHQEEARQETIAFADTLPDVIAKLHELNQAQINGYLADTVKSIREQKKELEGLGKEYDRTKEKVDLYTRQLEWAKKAGKSLDVINQIEKTLTNAILDHAQATRDLDSANRKLNDTTDYQSKLQDELNKKVSE